MSPLPRFLLPILALPALALHAAEPLPISGLWKSQTFQNAFTASYGIDSRIEPKVSTAEAEVLDAVASAMASGDRPAAIARLTGSSLLPGSAPLIFALGNLRFEEGRLEDALENFSRALDLYPNFRDAHRNLAVALIRAERFADAEPHLVRALELGARDGLTLGLLGYSHAVRDRHQAALQAYRLAQLTMPAEPQWKLGEAAALLHLDQPRATASIYDELLDLNPADPALWTAQADAWLRLGDPESAIANLELTRRMGRLSPADHLTLGHLYLDASLPRPALGAYRAALSATEPPALPRALDALDNLLRFRRWDDARELDSLIQNTPAYRAALDTESEPISSDLARLQRARAFIALETGDDPETAAAAAALQALVEQDPLDGAALVLLARFHHRAAKLEEALMLLEQAERDPEHESEALRLRGQILVERADYPAALDVLTRAQTLAPDPALQAYLEALTARTKN